MFVKQALHFLNSSDKYTNRGKNGQKSFVEMWCAVLTSGTTSGSNFRCNFRFWLLVQIPVLTSGWLPVQLLVLISGTTSGSDFRFWLLVWLPVQLPVLISSSTSGSDFWYIFWFWLLVWLPVWLAVILSSKTMIHSLFLVKIHCLANGLWIGQTKNCILFVAAWIVHISH